MIYIHKVIKIMYVNIGFLPNYPYHLISDEEMFEAFLKEDGFFATYYPCPCDDLREAYDTLLGCITSCINKYLNGEADTVPDWVYSYMIMRPITYESAPEDIDYICEMANIDQPEIIAVFTPEVARTCYEVSKQWLKKIPNKINERPPTMFGETHVTKSLRLTAANVLLDSDLAGVNG